jgi:hypothetical protein
MSTETRQATTVRSFRVTPEEAAAIHAAAAARGVGPSTFSKAAALRAAGRSAPAARRRRGPDVEETARLAAAVGRLGGLAKVLVLQGRKGRVDTADVRALVAEVAALRASLASEAER